MEGEFKFRKTYFKMVGAKKTDGNYGNVEGHTSLSVTVAYDSPDEIEGIKADLDKALELDDYVFGQIDDVLKQVANVEVKVESKPQQPQQPQGQKQWKQSINQGNTLASSNTGASNTKDKFKGHKDEPLADALIKKLVEDGWKEGKFGFEKKQPNEAWTVYINLDKQTNALSLNASSYDFILKAKNVGMNKQEGEFGEYLDALYKLVTEFRLGGT